MYRRSGTREVENTIDFDIKRECHIVAHDLKVRVAQKILNIAATAGEIVVYRQHFMTFFEQSPT